jgi:hypothetical protein
MKKNMMLRRCRALNKDALFHGWFPDDRIIIGGKGDGSVVSSTIAIVEFQDGSIGKVDPMKVQFTGTTEFINTNEEPKTAKWNYWPGWKGNHDQRIDDAKCSKCGYNHKTVYAPGELSSYCPGCGSIMTDTE